MSRGVALLAALLLSGGGAAAQADVEVKARLATCAGEAEVQRRLECLERLAAEPPERSRGLRPGPATHAAPARVTEARPGAYDEFVIRAKSNILAELDDPLGVQWRNLFVSGRKRQALCGELNGRDRRGDYTGYRRFLATAEPKVQDLEDPRQPFLFARLWEALCQEPIEKVR